MDLNRDPRKMAYGAAEEIRCLAVARAKGKFKGQQPRLTARQQTHLVQQHQSGEHTVAGLAELFSVSRATVHRVLERHRNAPAPSASGGQ